MKKKIKRTYKKFSDEIRLEEFKKQYLPQLKKFFLKYPFKNYQLNNIGINKKNMVKYLISTIYGREINNFSALEEDTLLGFISLRKLNYFSEMFGYYIYSIKHFLYDKKFKTNCQLLLDYSLLAIKNIDVVTCKIASDDISTIHSLEDSEFNFVGNQIDLILNINDYAPIQNIDKKNISIAKKEDLPQILKIIGKVHTKNPFIYDPYFDNNKVIKLYCELMKDSFLNDDFIIFVYKSNKKVIGFISVKFNKFFSKYSNKKCASLDFIGVDNQNSEKGIGTQLNICALNYLKNNSFDICAVKTLSDNYSSLRICSKVGFKITSSSLLFHKWITKVSL